MSITSGFEEYRWTSADGLGLYARVYDPGDAAAPAVLCLPGLTRNSRDFEALAPHLSRRYRVVCPDLRGRGFSARDPSWSNYHPGTYITDLRDLIGALGLTRFAVIGTSLGGLLAMMLPSVLAGGVAGIVLNDVGPEIDPIGADRIRSYAGRLPPVRSWDEAVQQLKTVYGAAWPDLPESAWPVLARRGAREGVDGVPVLDADPNIGEALRAGAQAIIDLWPLYGTLAGIPTLAIRGGLSDILNVATFERMKREKPDLLSLTVSNRGHVPLLDEPACLGAIDEFLAGLSYRFPSTTGSV